MRKVDLRMDEKYKYEIIKKLIDTKGNKKAAALKLKCSTRHINRLIKLYNDEGKCGFIHKNRGKKPANTFNQHIKSTIINLYLNEYSDANLKHFTEIVFQDLGVAVSDTTLSMWLKQVYTLSPKAHSKTKKTMKQTLKKLKKNSASNKSKNYIQETIDTIDSSLAHPRRPRCKYAGEMIQMDASSFEWVPNKIWHLHVAIDDATGDIVGAYFDTQETLKAYYNVFYQILNDYGIPAMFYTDKRTVFEYKRKDTLFDDEDTFTQFSYACHQLGVEIKTTSVAQAKGRVERLNQTLQSRLPIELRRANITSIEQANEFLISYKKNFNKQFALQLNSSKSVYELQPNAQDINNTLAVLDYRVIDSAHCIKYKNEYYIPLNKKLEKQYFSRHTKCMVINTFDNNIYVNIKEELYLLEKIKKYEEVSNNFDEVIPMPKKTTKHIPPMSHPWKQPSFLKYLEKQKHRQTDGADIR